MDVPSIHTVVGPEIDETEKRLTFLLIGAEGQNGDPVITCWTEIVPGPLHCTITGFAVFEPTIVPPVTLQSIENPGPDGVAVYEYVEPAQTVSGPTIASGGGTATTVTVTLEVSVQYRLGLSGVAVTVCNPPAVH
jgi:hypothetical protein